jgi:hypothetical protein
MCVGGLGCKCISHYWLWLTHLEIIMLDSLMVPWLDCAPRCWEKAWLE